MKKLDTQDWIAKAKEVHGDKFNYSMTSYANAKTKLEIECPVHGVHEMLPHHHIKGHGCPECGKRAINKNRKLSQEEFIERIKNIKGLSFENTIYKTKRDPVIVTCEVHGDYETTAEILLKGHGCRQCNQRGTWNMKTTDDFIKKAQSIHNGLYDYSEVNYTGVFEKVKIKCAKHGIFKQTPSVHLRNSGCPRCKHSKGELFIYNYLLDNEITFETQKTFTGCKDERHLKFDFYLPKYNACIEFDGEQHFRPSMNDHWGGRKGFEKRQLKDQIKTMYCGNNHIPLLRVKFNDVDIDNTVKKFLEMLK